MPRSLTVSSKWMIRSRLGVLIATSQAISLPLAMTFGEVSDILIAILVPFYGFVLAGFAAIHALS